MVGVWSVMSEMDSPPPNLPFAELLLNDDEEAPPATVLGRWVRRGGEVRQELAEIESVMRLRLYLFSCRCSAIRTLASKEGDLILGTRSVRSYRFTDSKSTLLFT
jgi:hypothetical protein